jgi:sugar phosphate isomerase/epimerase
VSIPLALHLSAVRGLCESQGLEAALEAVVSAGYEGVEFTGFFGLPAPRVRAALSRTGLRPVSCFAEADGLSGDLSRYFEYISSVGIRHLVCSRAGGGCDFPALAEKLAMLADKAAEYGLVFCYHHLAEELGRNPRGGLWLDTLLGAGPGDACVQLVIDTYWAERGGAGAVSLLKRYPVRCPLLHVSDMRDTDSFARAEIGCGIINLLRVVELAKAQGTEWFVVDENGAHTDSLEGIRRCAVSLRQLTMEA